MEAESGGSSEALTRLRPVCGRTGEISPITSLRSLADHCVPLRRAFSRFDLMFRRTVSSLYFK